MRPEIAASVKTRVVSEDAAEMNERSKAKPSYAGAAVSTTDDGRLRQARGGSTSS